MKRRIKRRIQELMVAMACLMLVVTGCGTTDEAQKSDTSSESLAEDSNDNSELPEDATENALEDTAENTTENQEAAYMLISAQEAKEIMDSSDDYVLLDVREADEYAEGHIEGAVQISYTELSTRAATELPVKDQCILVYCRSGRRSAIAAQQLVDMGYTNVKDFGGILDWPYETVK